MAWKTVKAEDLRWNPFETIGKNGSSSPQGQKKKATP